MLQLTRLSGPVFALNPDLIERAEATPDTVVTLVNGSKYVIRESLDELIALIRDYRADIVASASGGNGSGDAQRRHATARRDLSAPAPRATVVALHPEES